MTEPKCIGNWVDPPSGWRYGFSKIKTCDTDMEQWMRDSGYPEKDIKFAAGHCRFWPAFEGEEE